MTGIPRKETKVPEDKQPKIMTKPLPEILDELEDYIKRVEEAAKVAQAAARDSREAAAQAKLSGEKAAEAAKKAAEAAVAKVREDAARAAEKLGLKISAVEAQLNTLEKNARQEAMALDKSFLAMKEKHSKESPFLEG